MQILEYSRELADAKVILRVDNGGHISAKALGRICLNFNKKFIILNNIYFLLKFICFYYLSAVGYFSFCAALLQLDALLVLLLRATK